MINNENCFLSKSIEFSQSKDRKFDSRLKNSDSVYVVERDMNNGHDFVKTCKYFVVKSGY